MAVNVEGASPPVFEQIFRNARFAQGGNALFEGKVKGNPKPQVVWTRKGLQMKGNTMEYMLTAESEKNIIQYYLIYESLSILKRFQYL
jgi:hypothetical protein